jgi:hypothetical protein
MSAIPGDSADEEPRGRGIALQDGSWGRYAVAWDLRGDQLSTMRGMGVSWDAEDRLAWR